MDSLVEDGETDTETSPKALERQLSFAMESMAIRTPGPVAGREEEDKAFIRNRRRKSAQPTVPHESLLSLSTETDELVNRLLQPGAFDNPGGNTLNGESPSRIIRWQETIANSVSQNRAAKSQTPGRAIMPGTLIAPTPETSFASSQDPNLKAETISAPMTEPADDPYYESRESAPSNATERARPLARSMSSLEREIFISKLSDEASATIYIIPKADVDEIVAEAKSLQFIVYVNMSEDDNDSQALMILGREQKAVDALLKRVLDENVKARQTKQTPGRSSLKTAAGAAVVGAVGAWAGLAFS